MGVNEGIGFIVPAHEFTFSGTSTSPQKANHRWLFAAWRALVEEFRTAAG
jgi:hypothetical protein